MSFQVAIQPGQNEFRADADETLLVAAQRQNILLPHGCRNGVCGNCKVKVLDGVVDHGVATESVLSAAERRAGLTLLCCAQARSDLVVECRELGGAGIPARMFPSRVQRMERLAPDVMAIYLKLPPGERMDFRAGQYLEVLLRDGQRRSYSMANAPHDDEFIELHLGRVAGGLFSEYVFNRMKVRDILRLNGPHGSFYLREDSQAPIVFVAGGTGFAPVKAMIEHLIATGSQRPVHLYWGARSREGLYCHSLCESWAIEHSHICYVPVLSEPGVEDCWAGRTGLVHHAVADDFSDLSGCEVYACGLPAMIDAARKDFMGRCALPADSFFSDVFSFSSSSV